MILAGIIINLTCISLLLLIMLVKFRLFFKRRKNLLLLLFLLFFIPQVLLNSKTYLHYFFLLGQLASLGGFVLEHLKARDRSLWIWFSGILFLAGFSVPFTGFPYSYFFFPVILLYFIFHLWIFFKALGKPLAAPFRFIILVYSFYIILCLAEILPFFSWIGGRQLFFIPLSLLGSGYLLLFREELLTDAVSDKVVNSLFDKTIKAEEIACFQNRLIEVGLVSMGIVHELKNIFSSVTLSLEVLKEQSPEEADNDCYEVLESGILRAKYFTEKMLAKVVREPSDRESVLLNRDLAPLFGLLRAHYRRASIFIEQEIPDAISLFVRRTDLELILMNLIRNSAEAVTESDSQEKIIRVQASASEGKVVLVIDDSGPGISGELERKLFDTGEEVGRGVRVGLYLVKMLVKRNGGIVEYIPGALGASFRIIFPGNPV